MNTRIVLAATGDAAGIACGFERTRNYIDRCEARFTRFDPASELSALNRAAGTWFNASPELYALMQEAYALHMATEGWFDPAVLNALERVGYDTSFESVGTGMNAFVAPWVAEDSFRALSFHADESAIWMPRGMRVDLGGIAKGWIAERAAQRLAEYSGACAVNAGGDLFAIGSPDGGEMWEVELEDPEDADCTMALLHVPGDAVATSTVTKRKWKQGAQERYHLIDPHTGLPAATDWLSVTVFAPHAAIAEVYAKALLIAGPSRAGELAAGCEEIEFIAVARNKTLVGSERAGEFLHGTNGLE